MILCCNLYNYTDSIARFYCNVNGYNANFYGFFKNFSQEKTAQSGGAVGRFLDRQEKVTHQLSWWFFTILRLRLVPPKAGRA